LSSIAAEAEDYWGGGASPGLRMPTPSILILQYLFLVLCCSTVAESPDQALRRNFQKGDSIHFQFHLVPTEKKRLQ
jgi:hypothetical protein